MSKIFKNENQLQEWVKAAEGIRKRFGVDKALGYLIGEKFYETVYILHSSQKLIGSIVEERKKPDYNPIRETIYGNRKLVTNLDEIYKKDMAIMTEAEELLVKFATLIKGAFETYEIRKYFESNPRLGTMRHITSDEEYDFLTRNRAVEHSIDTEIEDALIFGAMMKYFQIALNNP